MGPSAQAAARAPGIGCCGRIQYLSGSGTNNDWRSSTYQRIPYGGRPSLPKTPVTTPSNSPWQMSDPGPTNWSPISASTVNPPSDPSPRVNVEPRDRRTQGPVVPIPGLCGRRTEGTSNRARSGVPPPSRQVEALWPARSALRADLPRARSRCRGCATTIHCGTGHAATPTTSPPRWIARDACIEPPFATIAPEAAALFSADPAVISEAVLSMEGCAPGRR